MGGNEKMREIRYEELKAKHQEEVNKLPIYFAFGERQIDELIEKLGFKDENELKENVFTIGAGSVILNKDKDKVLNTLLKHDKEMIKLFENDEFLQSAFEYELANHEYIITYDISDTLRALGIKLEEYQENERYQNIMKVAISNYKKEMEKMGW